MAMYRPLLALLVLVLVAGCTSGTSAGDGDDMGGTALDVQHVTPQDTKHRDDGFSVTRVGDRVRLEVYAGARSTGGYSVAIEAVRRVRDTLIVDAAVDVPAEDAIVTQAFTYPADAVTFPLDTGAYRVRLHLTEAGNTTTTERTVIIR